MPRVQARQIMMLTGHLPDRSQGQPTTPAVEEVKLAVIKCVMAFCDSVARTGQDFFYDVEGMRIVSDCIGMILTVSNSVKGTALRVESMKALRAVLFTCARHPDVLAAFFPGVVSMVVKLTFVWSTHAERCLEAMVLSIELVADMICGVLGDEETLKIPISSEYVGNAIAASVKIQRDQGWLANTVSQTKRVVASTLRYRAFFHLPVRKAVLDLCRELITNCGSALKAVIPNLVQALIILSGDQDNDLRATASSTLRVMTVTSQNVSESLSDNVHSWALALPSAMGSGDSALQTRLITRISVGFRLITSSGLESKQLDDNLAKSIREGLISAVSRQAGTPYIQDEPFSFDTLLANNQATPMGGHKLPQFPEILLPHQGQRDAVVPMKDLLAAMGDTQDVGLLLAQYYVRESASVGAPASKRSPSLWVALQLFETVLENSMDMLDYLEGELAPPLQKQVADEILAVALSVLSDATKLGIAPHDDSTSPALQCLALESICLVAHAQGRSFRVNLSECLYPVVHLLGASSGMVQNHAIIALNHLARSCEYPSAKDIVLGNVDYLLNAVSLKFSTFDLTPQAPVVLGMMVKLAGAGIVPFLDDLVVSIFVALDEFHGYRELCESLWAVLRQVVRESTSSGELATIEEGNGLHLETGKPLTGTQLIEYIEADMRNERGKAVAGLTDEDAASIPEAEQDGAIAPGEGEGSTPTKAYEIIHQIALLSRHYITHESYTLRLKILDLIGDAFPFLASNESKFLPLVNDLWPGVLERLMEDNHIIVIAAAGSIAELAKCCQGFLTSRVDDAWPDIKRVFTQAIRNVEKEGNPPGKDSKSQSANYKVWDALCKMLISIIDNVQPADEILDDLCHVLRGEGLLARADLRQAVERVNMDLVWLELAIRKDNLREPDGETTLIPVLGGMEFRPIRFL